MPQMSPSNWMLIFFTMKFCLFSIICVIFFVFNMYIIIYGNSLKESVNTDIELGGNSPTLDEFNSNFNMIISMSIF